MAGFVVGLSPQAAAVGAPAVEVSLGVHVFGKPTPVDAVVAQVGADGVGWTQAGPGMGFAAGIQRGPSSFEVATDGSVWLLDQVNKRLLGWPPGKPDRPTMTVPLSFMPDAFALGSNGTFYVTEYVLGPNMILRSVAADGRVIWQAPMAVMNASGVEIWRGPDGVLYASANRPTPVTTAAGTPLPLDQQHPLDENHLALPDGGQLVLSPSSTRELTVARLDSAGRAVRNWRITSGTDIAPKWRGRTALVGDDPVVTLFVQDPPSGRSETLALRLTRSGAQPRLQLKNAIWGDEPTAEFQVGPGQYYYQLQTSRTTGVKIARFTLVGAAPTSTTSGGAVVPAPAPSQAWPTPTVAQTPSTTSMPTAQQPPATSTSGSWWLWTAGAVVVVLAALVGVLLIRRRRWHPTTTTPPTTRSH